MEAKASGGCVLKEQVGKDRLYEDMQMPHCVLGNMDGEDKPLKVKSHIVDEET